MFTQVSISQEGPTVGHFDLLMTEPCVPRAVTDGKSRPTDSTILVVFSREAWYILVYQGQ